MADEFTQFVKIDRSHAVCSPSYYVILSIDHINNKLYAIFYSNIHVAIPIPLTLTSDSIIKKLNTNFEKYSMRHTPGFNIVKRRVIIAT